MRQVSRQRLVRTASAIGIEVVPQDLHELPQLAGREALYGELPDRHQKQEFVSLVANHTMVNEQMHLILRGFRRDAHPMAVMTGMAG